MLRFVNMIIFLLPISAYAFVTSPNLSQRPSSYTMSLGSTQNLDTVVEHDATYDTPSECYIIYPEEAASDDGDELPYMVCTNSPEEYAWFHGVDEDLMEPKNASTPLSAMECEETESSRGVPEWECQLRP